MMNPSSPPRKARFKVGDRVRVVGPSVRPRQDNRGKVSEVIGSSSATVVYRYRVIFADETIETFFGFELEPLEP